MGAQANETSEMTVDSVPEAEVDAIDAIMSEIETLQAEMAEVQSAPTHVAVPAKAVTPVEPVSATASEPDPVEEPSGIEDFHATADDGSMEETLVGIKDESEAVAVDPEDSRAAAEAMAEAMVEEPIEEQVDEQVDEVEEEEESRMAQPQPGATAGNDGSLTLTVSGAMTLKLRYEGGGQDITIGFTDNSLSVTLADGTEFKVPVTRTAPQQGAATGGRRGRRLRAA